MAGNSNDQGRSVASRLLAVLDCFDFDHPRLTLTEVAATAGLPLSTTRRLIMELVSWGGLERLPDGDYRIGLRLWRIGSLAPAQRYLSGAALPVMGDLCETTWENVQLVVLDGEAALCIEKVCSSRAVPTATEVGGRLPLHATAAGKVLLAHAPAEVFRHLVEVGLPRMTPRTITETGRLATALREVRQTGAGFSHEEMTLGAVSVAVPVTGPDGRVHAALGIVTHSHSNLDRLTPAVRMAAVSISRDLARNIGAGLPSSSRKSLFTPTSLPKLRSALFN